MRLQFGLALAAAFTLLLSPNGRAEQREEQVARRVSESARLDLKSLTARAYAGNPNAQYALAKVYEEGQGGIKKDLAFALSWYEEAARNGLRVATEKLQKLRTQEN